MQGMRLHDRVGAFFLGNRNRSGAVWDQRLAFPHTPSKIAQMNRILVFRWIVFLLAAAYCLRMVLFSSYEHFGGPFRFLTVWALFASFFCASRMLALMEGRSQKRWDGFVGMTTTLNAMVVFLYWRLYLADPSSVTRDGELGAFYLEIYLHALGPLLQWIDATFIHRSFRRIWASLLWLFGLISVYVLWTEGLVQRFATSPDGTVSNGLPYRFLNNLELPDRMTFYLVNLGSAAVLLLAFALIAWVVRRQFPAPEAP